jgi:hypothetical protein
MPDEDPSLVHGLSNLNLLDQLQDGTTQPTVDAIKSKAAPALAGIDHVLDALREVTKPTTFSHLFLLLARFPNTHQHFPNTIPLYTALLPGEHRRSSAGP